MNNSKNDLEKFTHTEILKILKKINHSDFFTFEGLINENIRNLLKVIIYTINF